VARASGKVGAARGACCVSPRHASVDWMGLGRARAACVCQRRSLTQRRARAAPLRSIGGRRRHLLRRQRLPASTDMGIITSPRYRHVTTAARLSSSLSRLLGRTDRACSSSRRVGGPAELSSQLTDSDAGRQRQLGIRRFVYAHGMPNMHRSLCGQEVPRYARNIRCARATRSTGRVRSSLKRSCRWGNATGSI
jgi:hypothetical protein